MCVKQLQYMEMERWSIRNSNERPQSGSFQSEAPVKVFEDPNESLLKRDSNENFNENLSKAFKGVQRTQ